MSKFLIDVNLPRNFHLWSHEEFIHQSTISSFAKDNEIWAFAKTHNLTIITKDSDFSNRILLSQPPPKVIHIKFGNLKLDEFSNYLTKIWEQIKLLNETYKLVNVFIDRIEGID